EKKDCPPEKKDCRPNKSIDFFSQYNKTIAISPNFPQKPFFFNNTLMPTYEYRCDACTHEFEEFQYIKDEPLKKCPSCGRNKLRRLISGGAAIVFKGSGFYQTDYRSDAYKKSAQSESTTASTAAKTNPNSSCSNCPAATTCKDSTPTASESAKPTNPK
ncbi:MAG: zinc ribbon domain-containing protein, partial [Planctomycetaceae bacterium]|nr:zinc ribbon domain-containing protein [Planctomycetaceae bacterium]